EQRQQGRSWTPLQPAHQVVSAGGRERAYRGVDSAVESFAGGARKQSVGGWSGQPDESRRLHQALQVRRPALRRPGGLDVAHSLQERCVPDREESTSERRRRLEHSEAEHRYVRERVAGVERSTEGLRAVLDQEHAAALAHLPRQVEVDKTAEQVGYDEDPRAGG